MGADFRRFADDGDIDMVDHALPRRHALRGEGEELVRPRAAPLRVGGGKVAADIALGQRAEQGVD